MSARRPMPRRAGPARSTPTRPVLPIPRCTSMPKACNCDATKSEVRCSSKPSSGCACRSRRHPVISSCRTAIGSTTATAYSLLLDPDVGGLDDLPVALLLAPHVGHHFGGRVGRGVHAERHEALPQLRRLRRFLDFGGE